MLKVLLKKQFFELNKNFFYDSKKGELRTQASSVLFIGLYIVLMAFVLGGMFFMMGKSLCGALVQMQLDWLYFSIVGLIATTLGIFGSVFNTYTALYDAKDNDTLLSMPIPVYAIVLSRLAGVYAMGLLFSAVVLLPCSIAYWLVVSPCVSTIVGAVLLTVVVSLFVFVLSCILGWVVAKISRKINNKSFVTVVISVLFLAGYYFVYFRANVILQEILLRAREMAETIQTKVYPLYAVGLTGIGKPLPSFMVVGVVLLMTVAVYLIISHGFVRIVTDSGRTEVKQTKNRSLHEKSVFFAVLQREFGRFTSSANYMINCGLATLIMPALGIVLLVKGNDILTVMFRQFETTPDMIPVLFAVAVCVASSMNDCAAASVSLEGKTIWISQSLPIEAWTVLKAKMCVQWLLTAVPALFCSVCGIIVLKTGIVSSVFVVLMPQTCVLLSACFCLFVNLKKPNLTWTNELYPIKQSICILFAIFGVWLYALTIGGLYVLLASKVGPVAYLSIVSGITVFGVVILMRWLKTKGTAIYATL